MDDIQARYDALLTAAAELVATKAVYQPGASGEAQQAKLQQCLAAFYDSCDQASLQLECTRAYLLQEQAKSLAAGAPLGQKIDEDTAKKLDERTARFAAELVRPTLPAAGQQ